VRSIAFKYGFSAAKRRAKTADELIGFRRTNGGSESLEQWIH
jgi:hypothetical protein